MESTCAQMLDETVDVPFEDRVGREAAWPITALATTVLQMNLGYRCNQHCAHCHLDSGPDREEQMSQEVMEAALEFADRSGITEFDLTGGAPELNPRFRWLVKTLRARDHGVIDRCNLTILSERGQEDLPRFFADHRVRVVASLPHYAAQTTDRVRGRSVFDRSIEGLRALNEAGYGRPGGELQLDLVHSPAGAFLPGCQVSLESDFRERLRDNHGVSFTGLIAMTNMPAGRFLKFLIRSGNLSRYMHRLEQNFNPATLELLMCRTTLSVAWDGILYDCDFNQSLGLPIRNGSALNVGKVRPDKLLGRAIRCRSHCYGCTAGAGSSCGGAVTS